MLRTLLDILFPPICLNCRRGVKSGEVACDRCFSSIKIFVTFFCGQCRARLPKNEKICHRDFPYLLGAAADYQDETVKNLVRNLKFGFIQSAARPLASLLIAYIERARQPLSGFIPLEAERPAVSAAGMNACFPTANVRFNTPRGLLTGFIVVPIPLSRARERKRGFNQSFLIAKVFAEYFNLELNSDILARDKNTKAQSEIKNFEQKRENVEDCFSIKNSDLVKGKNFILIDDVVTSGATFFEAANALKQNGAKKIIALAAAKS